MADSQASDKPKLLPVADDDSNKSFLSMHPPRTGELDLLSQLFVKEIERVNKGRTATCSRELARKERLKDLNQWGSQNNLDANLEKIADLDLLIDLARRCNAVELEGVEQNVGAILTNTQEVLQGMRRRIVDNPIANEEVFSHIIDGCMKNSFSRHS